MFSSVQIFIVPQEEILLAATLHINRNANNMDTIQTPCRLHTHTVRLLCVCVWVCENPELMAPPLISRADRVSSAGCDEITAMRGVSLIMKLL